MNDGAQAEQRAAQYLRQQGLKQVAQNCRSRFGEIDLIMQDGATLVFVEVRLRRNTGFGGAAASIDARKQQRIIRTAQQYLAGLAHIPPCRFDAVLIDNDGMQWLKNAFGA
ncbi:MAG: YraN family protein [Gallionellales bacterium RIFCSPLOWO2_12_FULL_59_22]|nr:MAG: YraN family protein [Gallionellales bacterium RIFCSPLOWO2_02_FULL_59_110]OGT04118.1 MAG: YraN family protein [Gallionellales bacterium RIFCSPLOWO2_02_58_13]OGT13115.1 MAG: YraN family protein [Gallionellales bacterium RIFCSPLOWO2_12_FULL_59_22]